jgi:hypothetical protein
MPNRWIEFVKEFAVKNNITYGCALTKPELKTEYYDKYPKKGKGEKEPVKVVEEDLVMEIEPVKKKKTRKPKAKKLEPLTLSDLPDLEDF